MDLSEMKVCAKNVVSVQDAINAPLLKLNIKLDQTTVAPNTSDLIIYVDKSATPTSNRKAYSFSLREKLKYLNNVTDEFVMEPVVEDERVKVRCYVKRCIGNDAILIDEEMEMLDLKTIVLFEGVNYISTNYSNAIIDVVYPKNNDLVNYFLNSTLFGIINSNKILSLDDIYFKDCFTEVDAGINAEFNKVTMKCFNSINNAFSMDCEGNLVVNTVTTKESMPTEEFLTFNDIYPVGSIYMSVNAVNPSTLFGGSWEQIKDRFLLAAGTTYKAGATGGAATHTLTVNEIPAHKHNAATENFMSTSESASPGTAQNFNSGSYKRWAMSTTANTGGSKAHNNMPPYLAVYIWKRIA